MALEALSELKQGETLAVLVNDGKAVESLVRLADEQSCKFIREDEGDYTVVTLEPTKPIVTDKPLEKAISLMDIDGLNAPVVVFGSEAIGRGDKKVGRILANEIIFDLSFQEVMPSALVFLNSGVKLTCKGSSVINELRKIEALGANVYSDTVSLDAYGLSDELEVGEAIDPYNLARLMVMQPGLISL